MRDRIARALVWVLARLPLTRRTRPGRHSLDHFARSTATATPRPASAAAPAPAAGAEPAPDPDVWRRPWTGPSSAEALEVFRAEEARYLSVEQRERFYATAFAERGYDYPYVARGVHQVRPRTAGTPEGMAA
ncbi:hypothetical protein JNUCC64_17635 [Streptomyces sp. JNUCC 64]